MQAKMSSKITLDKDTFKALAADSRVEILKRLAEHKLTLTDLSEKMEMSPSTIKEHLDRLVAAGLIEQIDSDTKWKYYRLTPKGEGILSPYESKVWILLATSVLTLVGAAMSFTQRMASHAKPGSLIPRVPTLPVKEKMSAASGQALQKGAEDAAGAAAGSLSDAASNLTDDWMLTESLKVAKEGAVPKAAQAVNETLRSMAYESESHKMYLKKSADMYYEQANYAPSIPDRLSEVANGSVDAAAKGADSIGKALSTRAADADMAVKYAADGITTTISSQVTTIQERVTTTVADVATTTIPQAVEGMTDAAAKTTYMEALLDPVAAASMLLFLLSVAGIIYCMARIMGSRHAE